MKSKKTKTTVIKLDLAHNRSAYLEFVDNTVIFDDSDGEYGPIEFDINLLVDALEEHAKKCLIANIDLLNNK